MAEPILDFSTVLNDTDETVVSVVDMLFDLNMGHRCNHIELTWTLWKRIRQMIPAAKNVGPLPQYKGDGKSTLSE